MSTDKNEIVIGISKIKSFIMTFIAFGLFSVAIWAITKILTMPYGFDKIFLMTGISLLTIVFGLAGISGIKKLLINQHGLRINDNGIDINIGPNKGQFIKWTEITDLKTHNQVQGPLSILIFVKNPNDITDNLYGLKRFLIKMNTVSHKTPVSLTSNWLDCSFEELLEILIEKLKKNGAQHAI